MSKKNNKTKRVIFRNGQSPGDIVALSYGIKALKEQYSKDFIVDVRTPCAEIFEGNPHITTLDEKDPRVRIIDIDYPTIHVSDQKPVKYVNSFLHEMGRRLFIKLDPTEWKGVVYIRDEEKCWYSAIYEKLGKDVPYFIIDAGHKKDFTCKAYDFTRYQEVINRFPNLTFVQIGLNHPYHVHPKLEGKNLMNLIGQTDLRQIIRLVYNSYAVISPISLPMMLGFAIEPHPRFNKQNRLVITIAGGREGINWHHGPAGHYMLHTSGMLDCCSGGGCWKSRVVPLDDEDEKNTNLCRYPIELPTGQFIPKCMDMISVNSICDIIQMSLDSDENNFKSEI